MPLFATTGGNSCHSGGTCIAPSDGFSALWSGMLGIGSQCDAIAPYHGSCNSCGRIHAPSCPYSELCSANGGHLFVRCVDSGGVCKHHNWLRVDIADACPRDHPCNTCKGAENPCQEGMAHVDLCDGAFYQIMNVQPSWQGARVQVSLTGGGPTPPGPPHGSCTNNGPPPGSSYSCAQQKAWGKCGEPWMKGYCCNTCQ